MFHLILGIVLIVAGWSLMFLLVARVVGFNRIKDDE